MSQKPSRNIKRLNSLFEIIRITNENPRLTLDEIKSRAGGLTSALTFEEFNAFQAEEDSDFEADDPIDRPFTTGDLTIMREFFDNHTQKMGVLSRNSAPPLTKDQLVRNQINSNPKKVDRFQELLNNSKGQQFDKKQTERIIFLTLTQRSPDSTIDDLIKDLSG